MASTTYDPILEVRELPRFSTRRIESPGLGTALVLQAYDGSLSVLNAADSTLLSRWRHLRAFLVDVSEHQLRLEEPLPTSDPASIFQCVVTVSCQVADPVAVVARNIHDVGAEVGKPLTERMKAITRNFDNSRLHEAATAINSLLQGYSGDDTFKLHGFLVTLTGNQREPQAGTGRLEDSLEARLEMATRSLAVANDDNPLLRWNVELEKSVNQLSNELLALARPTSQQDEDWATVVTWPVYIYLSDGSEEAGAYVAGLLKDIWQGLDFDLTADDEPTIGSFWQKLLAKSTSPEAQQELHDRLIKIERALEIRAVSLPESLANMQNSQGLAALIQALANETSASIMLGPLLVLKTTNANGASMINVKLLTAAQLRILEWRPELLRDPESLLLLLGQSTLEEPGSETSTGPTAREQ